MQIRKVKPIVHHLHHQFLNTFFITFSALQSLKSSLVRVEADRDIKMKEKLAANDKVNRVAGAFESEINVSKFIFLQLQEL